MTIYLHPDAEQKLADAYAEAFSKATEIFAISAYLRSWSNFEVSTNCQDVTLIVGKDFGITRKNALKTALNWKNSVGKKCHFYVATEIMGFHPKILLWKRKHNGQFKHYLIIGSSNLTTAAFNSNYEANIRVKISEDTYNEITNWIANILSFSIPVNNAWIDQYQEQTDQPVSRPQKIVSSTNNELNLPIFPRLAISLAQRREQVFAFDDVRENLIQVIRECANENIKQKDFYDWLIENWNRELWKFQGNGVFRTPWQNTNWQLLCIALVNVIDCSDSDRDKTVVNSYNSLESSNQVRVRKAVFTEMLCHFFPTLYPLWNTPVVTWLKKENKWRTTRKITQGDNYINLAKILRNALKEHNNYPAQNLAELDHIIAAYCIYKGWSKNEKQHHSQRRTRT